MSTKELIKNFIYTFYAKYFLISRIYLSDTELNQLFITLHLHYLINNDTNRTWDSIGRRKSRIQLKAISNSKLLFLWILVSLILGFV